MDKLIYEQMRVTITNDGATIINLLDIVHPAAKTLVDIARSQDDEVGDGTTSVCLLAGEFLRSVKSFVEDGVHPQILIRGFRQAQAAALKRLREIAIEIKLDLQSSSEQDSGRDMLIQCASTTLNSKLIAGQKEFFANMIVDAVKWLDADKDLKFLGIKRVPGGSVKDSFLVQGVAFKKTFAYAGFEQQPKNFVNPKILILNVELELKSERQNAEIRISDPKQYQSIVDAEWKIIYDKLDAIVKSGAKIVLSKLPIGDLATQYFADRDIFCAGRVPDDDLQRVAAATGAVMQTSLHDLNETVLGLCGVFNEKQIGADRFNLFTECPRARTATIVLRGGAEQFIAESERSLHDAIMIVKRASQFRSIVGGGGAVEMELSRFLREYSLTLSDKTQMIVAAYAKALEVIPRQLAQNAGFDCTDITNELRAAHAKGDTWAGVDIENEGICDTVKSFVWEPTIVKLNALASATEAACIILSVDETVKNPKAQSNEDNRKVPAPRQPRRRR